MRPRDSNRRPVSFVFALVLAVLGCATTSPETARSQSPSAASDGSPRPTSGLFTLVGIPARTAEGHVVTYVHVAFDDREVAECAIEDGDPATCLVDHRLAAGLHQLRISVRCRNAETGDRLRCGQSYLDRITIGAGEALEYDLSVGIATPGTDASAQSRYIRRRGGPARQPSNCREALDQLSATASCDLTSLDASLASLEAVDARCSSAELRSESLRPLLDRAIATHVTGDVSTCHPSSVVNRIPALVLRSPPSEGIWPTGSLTGTSWSWAREPLRRVESEVWRSGEAASALAAALREARPRLEVVDQIIAAYTSDAGHAEILRIAMARPWSIDPRLPDGHRNYVILVGESFSLSTPEYARWLATQVAQDPRMHCDHGFLTRIIQLAFTQDDVVSRDEWRASKAMIEHTVADRPISGCDYVVRRRTGDEVPRIDRLREFAALDCSERRVERLRGRALDRITRSDPEHDVVDPVRAENQACLARE